MLKAESLLEWAAMIQKHSSAAKLLCKLTSTPWDDWIVDVACRITECPDKIEEVLDWLKTFGLIGSTALGEPDNQLPSEFESISDQMYRFGRAAFNSGMVSEQ